MVVMEMLVCNEVYTYVQCTLRTDLQKTVDCTYMWSAPASCQWFHKDHVQYTEGAVISFQCDQGFSPPEERPATCVRDEDTGSAVWDPITQLTQQHCQEEGPVQCEQQLH